MDYFGIMEKYKIIEELNTCIIGQRTSLSNPHLCQYLVMKSLNIKLLIHIRLLLLMSGRFPISLF